MSRGELLTRITIWVAIGGYAMGAALSLLRRESLKWQARARWAWTAGCAALVAHIICALHYYHTWSQESAYRETARQTAEVTGSDWGGGLYINYVFISMWIADVVWWWRGLDVYRRRHWLITALWQGIFVFMLFNATIVFKTGLTRWLGVGLYMSLLAFWLWSIRSRQLVSSR